MEMAWEMGGEFEFRDLVHKLGLIELIVLGQKIHEFDEVEDFDTPCFCLFREEL